MIDWTKSKMTVEDHEDLSAVVDRAEALATGLDRKATFMDLEAANMTCPLDFKKLLAFDDFSFMHDISGIHKHLNRDTGKLVNCFLPRCAK